METCTYDVFQKYCDQKNYADLYRNRLLNSMARKELFEEEQRLGKCFFDFTTEEIEAYLYSLTNGRHYKDDNIRLSPAYIRSLIYHYRSVFDFYMEQTGNYFSNPLKNIRVHARNNNKVNDSPIFTRSTLERISLFIDEHDEHFVYGDAQFTKLILWLFYSGCFDANDIVEMQEKDVDLVAGTAKLSGRTIQLKEECIELLKENHKIMEYKFGRVTNLMFPYHGSYVWFPYREERSPDGSDPHDYCYALHQARTPARVKDIIGKRLVKVRETTNDLVKPDLIYYRGVYDYVVSQCGKDRAKELIVSNSRNNAANVKEFERYLTEYGARIRDRIDIFKTKENLNLFV